MAPRKPPADPAADIIKIDQQIHDLLLRRANRLDALRRKQAEPAGAARLHPAEDAATVRRLAGRREGGFPLRAVVRIWREILTASLPAEIEYSVHVYAGENARGFWDLARSYFGSTLPLIGHASAAAVIHACAETRTAYGVVPFPESAENVSPWWAQLAAAGEGGPRIVAKLPLLLHDGGRFDYPNAYAIGSIAQSATGDDTSVLYFETSQEMSRTRLQTLLRQAGIEARIVAAGQEANRDQRRELLLETTDFVGEGDARIATLLASGGEAILRAVPVGGYANPLDLGTEEGPVE